MKPSPKSQKPPTLAKSPFEPVEVVDERNLSGQDRSFLEEHEKTIEAGRRTFLEVGAALLEIRDYNHGLLYKERYGTFENYCRERWEFGRSYAFRLMDAAEIYGEMLPRGNKMAVGALPTTEKQIRSLKKLPDRLRLPAWKRAVEAAGQGHVASRDVERVVRKVMEEEGIKPPRSSRRKPAKPEFLRISRSNLGKIRACLEQIRKGCVRPNPSGKIIRLVGEIEAILTGP